MTRALLLTALALVAGCRLDAPTDGDAPPVGDAPLVADSAAVQPPPAARADTSRVTPDEAATATLRADTSRHVAPTGLTVPVVGIAPADLVDTFDDARSEGRIHDAIDIPAPRGTPVVAAAPGRVARLFTSERGGLTVYVVGARARDGRWPVTYYAHLDAYAPGLAGGQTVRAGQALGTVGDSGNAQPGNTHLHFAIWTVDDPARFWDGEALNPYRLLGGGSGGR